MKIYIFADLEGISGVSGIEYVDGALAAVGRELMAGDINACAAACFDAGATEVVVRDGHSSGVNFPITSLDPRCYLVQGAVAGKRFPGIEGSTAIILLGYHAMAGTAGAILEHTYSSRTIMNVLLNGRRVGEIGIDAAIAAEYGCAVAMVSGDDKACAEAAEFVPEAVRCCVKEAYAVGCGKMMPLAAARRLIADSTKRALANLPAAPKPLSPATVRWELVERCPVPLESPGCRVIDARTYERTSETVERAFLG